MKILFATKSLKHQVAPNSGFTFGAFLVTLCFSGDFYYSTNTYLTN